MGSTEVRQMGSGEGGVRGPGGEEAAVLPRRFDGYLCTSFLGTDALGTVFRALSLTEGSAGFVRLRIFDAPELSAEAVAAVFREHEQKSAPAPPESPAIVQRSTLGVHDGVPYLAWNEAHGSSLDKVLSALSSAGRALPSEHALYIADRLSVALEHAARAARATARHGLVWPGFVTIGRDGGVRLGGFGVAPALLPQLSRPRLSREIAPYAAPETREGGMGETVADVYSLGAVLFEMLTGARPPARSAAENLPGEKSLPRGARDVLRNALGPSHIRTASAGFFRREIGQVLVANTLAPSSHALAQFVADLLGTAPSATDGAPVPVVVSQREEDEWEQALSRLEPSGEGLPLPLARSGPKARVPLPPASPPKRPSRRPPKNEPR
jgi:serine/threonine protein kinase